MRPAPHTRHDSLGVLTSDDEFTVNRDLIRRWWKDTSLQNQLKKDWYIDTYFLEEQVAFKDKWHKDMKKFKTEIEFFKWFEITGQLGHSKESLQTLVTRWYTKEQVVDSVTPL